MDLFHYVHMICLKNKYNYYIFYIIQRDRDHYRDRDRHHNRDRYGGGYGPPDHHRGGKFINSMYLNEFVFMQLSTK